MSKTKKIGKTKNSYERNKKKQRKDGKESKLKYLPILDDNEDHCMPYYVTKEIVLPRPDSFPWKTNLKDTNISEEEKLFSFWKDNQPFRNELIEDFVNNELKKEIGVVVADVVQEERK